MVDWFTFKKRHLSGVDKHYPHESRATHFSLRCVSAQNPPIVRLLRAEYRKNDSPKMTLLQLSLILFTVFLLSVGQILFKLASENIILTSAGILPSLLNIKLIVAFSVYSIATVLWLIALKGVPLRVAYPFAALAFFIVPTLAHFLLGEVLSWNTYVGASIIALGVIVSVSQ